MNPGQLLSHFDRISEAPDAIPRLRRFILDLAVRGKLVEQDPRDEPASELIKEIQAEKTKLVKAGKTRNQEPFESIEDMEIPFQIPQSWAWIPAVFPAYVLSDMGKKVQTKDVLESGEFPVVDQGKVLVRGYCNDRNKVVKVEAPIIVFGDHTRETKLIDFDFVVGADGVKLLHPISLFTRYYFLALQWLPLESRGYGRHFKLLRESSLPLPPLAEQQRIVAKVDEFMALCDRLEAMLAERESRRDRLAVAVHASFSDSSFPTPHSTFFINHLPRLTAKGEHIQQLRQTILNLAVRGQLVPQDPNDEPASALLKRIQAKKARRLVSEGEATERKGLDLSRHVDEPFNIPMTWLWVCLGDVAFGFRYGTSVKCSYEPTGQPVLRIPNIDNGRINIEDLKFGPLTAREVEDLRLELGDILMVRSNGSLNLVGRPALVEAHAVGFCYAGYLVRVRSSIRHLDMRYLLLALNSVHVREQIEIPIRTTVGLKNVNATELSRLTFPLPPLAEQHRIVAKVHELMVLCDRLEAQLTITQTESRRLLEAVLTPE